MSVIAKLIVRNQSEFGTGRLIELGCICENDLMAAYATTEQDRLFTRYSPQGEMKINQPSGYVLTPSFESGTPEETAPMSPPAAFYVMALHKDEHEYVEQGDRYMPDVNFPGSAAWAYGICHAVTRFGGDTARVEFRATNDGTIKGKGVERLNWRMSVDNPAASDQFKPGEQYWIALYPAEKFDVQATIAAAHGHPAPEASE